MMDRGQESDVSDQVIKQRPSVAQNFKGVFQMQSDLWQRRLGWVGMVAIILFCGALAQLKSAVADEDDTGPHPRPRPEIGERQVFQNQQAAVDRMVAYAMSDQDGGKYWLGVECREAQPELKAQLGLKDDEGLVVVHVAGEGAAAKAGLKRHDVIVSAGDEKLKRLSDLIKAVNATEGKEISLKILRGGKEQTISVTPAERPQVNAQIFARPGPGFMWPGGGPRPELPDNVSVTIVRHGKEPAKITVSRGDEKWEVSDKELDKLPDDLRPQVERMLGGGPMPGFNMRVEGMPMGGPPGFNLPALYGNAFPREGNSGPPPHDGNPPLRDGEHHPPPHDGGGPPRDGQQGPPPRGGPEGPGGFGGPMMMPGQIPPELMERLERLDRRLEMLQAEIGRMQDGQGDGPPRMRPHGPGKGPDGPPPRDDDHDGRPPRDGRRTGPPPGEGDHRGPPPDDGNHRGPPSGE
jgi:hypothetical protein